MKKVFSFFVLAAVVLLTSCGKEDTAEALNVDASKVATVKGIAHAQIDQTNTGTEYVPAGTKIFLKVNYSNLSSFANAGVYSMETTVGANGSFSFENVPVSNMGSSAVISGDQFTTSVKLSGDKTETQKFSVANQSVSLNVGSTGYVTMDYNFGSTFQ